MTELFELTDVRVHEGGREILRGVTTTIPEGGITVLTGPSGSGKSTLLRLCNRLAVPSSGTVRLRGRDLMTIDPVELRRRVGMVFQRPTPFPGTVWDNLRAAATVARSDAITLLDQVGLGSELLDQEATSLSGGEAQRMCLARTLATGGDVVLADECTSSLDAAASAVVEQAARALAERGHTIVWVTHDEAQADRLADHRRHLEQGRVVR